MFIGTPSLKNVFFALVYCFLKNFVEFRPFFFSRLHLVTEKNSVLMTRYSMLVIHCKHPSLNLPVSFLYRLLILPQPLSIYFIPLVHEVVVGILNFLPHASLQKQ